MNRQGVQGSGRVVADVDLLHEFAAVCQSVAGDLEALSTKAQSKASTLSGPAGCADSLRRACDVAGERALQLIRDAAGALQTHGQGLDRVAAALEETDARSSTAIRDSRPASADGERAT